MNIATISLTLEVFQLAKGVKLVKEEREKGFMITNEKFDEILLKADIKR